MYKVKILFLVILFFCSSNVYAGIRPSFALDYCAWNATDIVVATEGEEIDGNFTVLETLKGELYTNQLISVPELALFKSEQSRLVNDGFPGEVNNNPPRYVSGKKMILFLKKDAADKWKSAAFFGEMNVSVVWLEAGKAFAFAQIENPGPSILIEYSHSEIEIREKAYEIIETRNSIDSALKIKNKAGRAEELEKFVESDKYFIRREVFSELQKCGESALPVLRKLLNDDSLLGIHNEIIESLATAGGIKTGNELTAIVKEELKFWKKTAPDLEQDWWNNIDSELINRRSHYSKVLEAIRQLKNLKFAGSKKIVMQFRDFWRSQPKLEDKNGLSQMSEECDELLKEISVK